MKLISSNAINKELAEVNLQEVSNTLIIENAVGNIEIRRSEDTGLRVRTTLQALNNRSGESTLEELAQNTEVSLITKGKTDVHGGGPLLSIKTSVGSITVENK
ncbi:hypothetical protein PC115_g24387 [Phytophthora cactorum]|uniref:Uncharacterized protein n=1 Tax=Phytophthora cactorum TaxID=29920 RepID=A0A8T1A8J6_9STRA|nr:hypothetical protein PC115_g24387 [Phytophthora cactorum]